MTSPSSLDYPTISPSNNSDETYLVSDTRGRWGRIFKPNPNSPYNVACRMEAETRKKATEKRAAERAARAATCEHNFQILTKEWQTQSYYTDPAARSRYKGSVLTHRKQVLFCPTCEVTRDPW